MTDRIWAAVYAVTDHGPYALSLAPPVPPAWRPFIQAIGGILIVVGVIIFVLILLGIEVATGSRP
jgi:small-conductance mechanosensitive channel